MKNLKFRIVILCSVFCVLCLVMGCQTPQKGSEGASADVMRRAQIVGTENIQLKKTIAEKDAQIAELNKQIEAAQAKIGELEVMNEDVYKGLMQNLLDCSTKLETYEKEK